VLGLGQTQGVLSFGSTLRSTS